MKILWTDELSEDMAGRYRYQEILRELEAPEEVLDEIRKILQVPNGYSIVGWIKLKRKILGD